MDNKELNAAVNQLVELMDESFGLPGYKDYIKENFLPIGQDFLDW